MIARIRALSAWWDRMEDEHGWFEALELVAIMAMATTAIVFFYAGMGGA